MADPSVASVWSFCRAVDSVCSDSRVEKGIVDCQGCLADVATYWGGTAGEELVGEGYLLNAGRSQGWKHTFGGAFQRSLNTFPWLPKWIERTKALAYFLKDKAIVSEVARSLRMKKAALGEGLKTLKLPAFAHW